jgi:SulP family sulfate permease
MDSSALMAFRRIGQIAEEKAFRVYVAAADGQLRELFDRARIWREDRFIAAESADRALQAAEDRLVAASTRGISQQKFADALAVLAPAPISEERLAAYIEHIELEPNEMLMRLGDPAEAIFFVESGHVTAELEREGASPVRLQTSAPGALIGEIAVLRDGVRTASVRAENACRLARLSKAALARMEKDDPQLATLIQRLIITQLADKLANTTRIVDVGLH